MPLTSSERGQGPQSPKVVSPVQALARPVLRSRACLKELAGRLSPLRPAVLLAFAVLPLVQVAACPLLRSRACPLEPARQSSPLRLAGLRAFAVLPPAVVPVLLQVVLPLATVPMARAAAHSMLGSAAA